MIASLGFILIVFIGYSAGGAMQTIAVRNALNDIPGIGNRPLLIKMYPAIENLQSDIYEVYSEPYTYSLRAASAVAIMQGEEESNPPTKGEIVFYQRHPPTGEILIKGNLTGLPPGKHGLHIHQSGDLREGCQKLGPHFNPFLHQHGDLSDPVRHVGDLGNIEIREDGTANFNKLNSIISLYGGPRSIVGRGIVITEKIDDLGRGGNVESTINGDSGKAIACGVIAYIK